MTEERGQLFSMGRVLDVRDFDQPRRVDDLLDEMEAEVVLGAWRAGYSPIEGTWSMWMDQALGRTVPRVDYAVFGLRRLARGWDAA